MHLTIVCLYFVRNFQFVLEENTTTTTVYTRAPDTLLYNLKSDLTSTTCTRCILYLIQLYVYCHILV